jgi:hypothetical protein
MKKIGSFVIVGIVVGFISGWITFSFVRSSQRELANKRGSSIPYEKDGFPSRSHDLSLILIKEYIHQLKLQSIKGSHDSAKKLFYIYEFFGDHQKSFFWASYHDHLEGGRVGEDFPGIAKRNLEYQVEEIDSLKLEAIKGSLDAARRLFSRLTFHDRDYESSFFWADLIKSFGDQSDKGDILEMARRNAESEVLSVSN